MSNHPEQLLAERISDLFVGFLALLWIISAPLTFMAGGALGGFSFVIFLLGCVFLLCALVGIVMAFCVVYKWMKAPGYTPDDAAPWTFDDADLMVLAWLRKHATKAK